MIFFRTLLFLKACELSDYLYQKMIKRRTSNSCHYSEKRNILPPLPPNKNGRSPHQNPISNPSNPIIKDSISQHIKSSLKNMTVVEKQNQSDQINSSRNCLQDQLIYEVGSSHNNYVRSSLHITQTRQNGEMTYRKRNRNSFKIRSRRDHHDNISMRNNKNKQNGNTQIYGKQMKKIKKNNIEFQGASSKDQQETAGKTKKNLPQQKIEMRRAPLGKGNISSNDEIAQIRKVKLKFNVRERRLSNRQGIKYEQFWECHSKNLESDDHKFFHQRIQHDHNSQFRKDNQKKQQSHSTPKLNIIQSGGEKAKESKQNKNLSHQNQIQNNHSNINQAYHQCYELKQGKFQSTTRNDLIINIPTSQEIDIPSQAQNFMRFPMPKKLKKARRPAFKDISNHPNGRPTRKASIIQKYKGEISENNGEVCQNNKQQQTKGQKIKELGIQSLQISELDNSSKDKKDKSKKRRKIDECKTHKVIWGSSKSKPFNVGVSSIFTSEMPRDHPLESLKQLYLQIK